MLVAQQPYILGGLPTPAIGGIIIFSAIVIFPIVLDLTKYNILINSFQTLSISISSAGYTISTSNNYTIGINWIEQQ